MKRAPALNRLAVGALAGAALTIGGTVGPTLDAGPAKPEYLPYVEFTADD